jgi:hypothetical protein
MPETEDEMKTYTTNKFTDAVTLCAIGQRLIRVTRKRHHRLYVFEETGALVTTLAKMPIKVDEEAWAAAEKLVRSTRRPPVTRQSLIAKGLLKPAPIAEVAKPAPAPAPASIIVPEPVSKIAPEIPEELTHAEFDALVAQSLAIPKPMPKIVAPKPAPKVQLPPGSTFNPFANLRDLLVTP